MDGLLTTIAVVAAAWLHGYVTAAAHGSGTDRWQALRAPAARTFGFEADEPEPGKRKEG